MVDISDKNEHWKAKGLLGNSLFIWMVTSSIGIGSGLSILSLFFLLFLGEGQHNNIQLMHARKCSALSTGLHIK